MKHARIHGAAALVVSLLSVTSSRDAAAAKEAGLGAAFDVRVPMGDLRRLVPNASFSGFQAKWDIFPLDALSIGFQVQYNLFQRPPATGTATSDEGAITGTTFRFASFWSCLPTVRYYLFQRSALRPYAEVGAGMIGASSVVLVSDVSQRDVSIAVIVQPSAGLLWRISPERTASEAEGDAPALGSSRKPPESMIGLTASATYAFTTADVVGASDVAYAGLQIGIYAKP